MRSDFLIIGAGIVGITIARELKQRYPDQSIVVIEKGQACAEHASGRNSGVLHAGFYYTADSLKAKFTRDGNHMLTEYCEEHGLQINKAGKLVVAKNEQEDAMLDELLRRAKNNQVDLQEVSIEEAKEIEPRVITHSRALFSPTTASVDPLSVTQSMEAAAKSSGIDFEYETGFIRKESGNVVTTNKGTREAGYIVNTAGLYADKIAREFGFSQSYHILPFKGLYLYATNAEEKVNTNIYPVPDLRNPFLGVHFTVTVKGQSKIGPTAIPAFWREQYDWINNFSMSELMEIISRQTNLLFNSNFGFRQLAVEEIKKYSRSYLTRQAGMLLTGVKEANYQKWGKPGIRAQLVNMRERKLEMDFVVEGDAQSMHVLNAVSPAFTCAIPFSRHVVDLIDNKIKH